MNRMLYKLTSENLRLPVAATREGGLIEAPAGLLPIVFWPDGSVCWEGNLFLLKGIERNLSRRNRGGTLREHAKHISHLIRFCQGNRVDFVNLTDSQFTLFVNGLKAERKRSHPELRYRGDTQVSTIARTCLAFLVYVEELYPGSNLIGQNGQIRAERRSFSVKASMGVIERSYWHHHAIPSPTASRRRLPISTAVIDQLITANRDISPSTFIRRRRYVALRSFEITGARRAEVHNLMVSDLLEAAKTGELPVFNAKKRSEKSKRYIPISAADLKILTDYAYKYRARIIRSTIGSTADHSYLFVSEVTGRQLSVETLSNEMAKLRRAANVDSEAVLHSFRHRFITKIFVWLIEEHHFSTANELRTAILSTETIKRKVMEWTGHSDIRSLDRYIHLAFAEVSNYKRPLNIVAAKKEIEAVLSHMNDLKAEAAERNPEAVVKLVENMLGAVVERLRAITEHRE